MSGGKFKKGVDGVLSRLARRKTYGLEEADPLASHSGGSATLAKVLNTFDLTLLGVGSTLGVGIYVLAGSVAFDTAGPAVCISFMVAAIASAFAAMSYAEFGARVPKAGSAYVYSYVTVGEFIAFVIGWNLILEYLIGTASVARAFSANLDALTNNTMSNWFNQTMPMHSDALSPYVDLLCLVVTLLLAVLLALGVRSSAIFTNIFTFVNISVVIFVIIGGSINADGANWKIPQEQVPEGFGVGGFVPYGFAGIMAGAAKCFFAFVGFDSIASTGEEAKNPKRSIPFAINLTLVIVFFAYFGVSTVITLMVPYYEQDPNTPLVSAFEKIDWYIASWTISIGSLFGLAASLLGAMIPLPRIIYAQAKDGMVFRFLGIINPRFQTPVIATAISGVAAAILGAIFDLQSLVDMMSIGTLLAYTLVGISVLILRYEEAEQSTTSSEGSSNISSAESQKGRRREPTKTTSRNAIYATAVYCLFTLVFCILLVVIENNTSEWIYFGIGITGGPMILMALYLVMLPRSNEDLYFKVPGVPIVPCLSVIINLYLMCKLDSQTWIRFGVWMALGFVMYFGYGIWNSSEEYVRKGKIPPGGTQPLPQPRSSEAPAKRQLEEPISEKKLAVKVIPVTSLDDDPVGPVRLVSVQHHRQEVSPLDDTIMKLAALQAHRAAQEVFDKDRSKRQEAEEEDAKGKAQMAQAMIHAHLAADKVFQETREKRAKEEEDKKKEMILFAQQMLHAHEEADKVFQATRAKNLEANKKETGEMAEQMMQAHLAAERVFQEDRDRKVVEDDEGQLITPKRSTIPPKETRPMFAVMEELKTKTTPIDPDEDIGSDQQTGASTPGSNENEASSILMLNELTKAFDQAIKAGEPEDGETGVMPSSIVQQQQNE